MPIQFRLTLPFARRSHPYARLPSNSPPSSSRRNSRSYTSSPTLSSPDPYPISQQTRQKRYHQLAILSLALSIFSLICFLSRPRPPTAYPIDRFDLSLSSHVRPPGVLSGLLGSLSRNDPCRTWDPDLPEWQDPEGCLKARQYRQTMRVLEREERAEHDHWYFTLEHNRETFRNLSRCFLPTWSANYTACAEKPLVLSGWWYTAEVLTGATTGEVIWQSSVVKQLEQLGVFWAAVGPYVNWVEVAEMMPDVYRQIWVPDVDSISCTTDPRCIAPEHYAPPWNATDLSVLVPQEEKGIIKIWQIIAMDYWGARPKSIANSDTYFGPNTVEGWSFQPLGVEWIATPWPLPGGHFHLAYSIEDICMQLPYKSHAERNDSVLLFMKRSDYFSWPEITPPKHLTNLSRIAPFDLLTTTQIVDGHPLPEGFVSLGPQTRDEYEKLVGDVKVMLGMGNPMISPSVYTALCQGTPVVIPFLQKEGNLEGWNAYGRVSQHGPAALIGPPYVYSYYRHDYDSLVQAVMKAFNTPIERYIPPEMTHSFALSQTRLLLETDFEALFHTKVAANGGRLPRLIAGARERCYEQKRCRKMLPAGVIKRQIRGLG